MTKVQRVLPDEVYCHLQLMALAFGGIGAGEFVNGDGEPLCAHGLCGRSGFEAPIHYYAAQLSKAGIGWNVSDRVVRAHNARHRPLPRTDSRISFEAWCKELGVVPASHVNRKWANA